MNCDQFIAQLSSWLDGALSPEEAQQMLTHAEECRDCAQWNETMRKMLSQALTMGEVPVPEAQAKAWRSAIRKELSPQKEKPSKKVFWLRMGAVAIALLLVVGLTAVARQQRGVSVEFPVMQAQNDALPKASPPLGGVEPAVAPEPFAVGTESMQGLAMRRLEENDSADTAVLFITDDAAAQGAQPAGTMLKRSAWVSLSTRQFDTDAEKLLLLPTQLEGWTERQALSGKSYEEDGEGRTLSLTLRVPAENLEEALSYLSGIGTLEARETYAEDVSERYYDTQGRLDSALALRGQLQALLAKAEDVETLATLTQQLSETQHTIDTLQGVLRGMDSRVQYSEVSISLSEQRPGGLAPKTSTSLWTRIREGFVNSINAVLSFLGDMMVTVVWLLPWLVPIALVAWLILWLIRKRRK